MAGESESKSAVGRRFSLVRLSTVMIICLVLVGLMLALAEGAAYLWRPIAVALYVVVLLLTVLSLAARLLPGDAGTAEAETSLVIVGALGVIVSFSELSRHLYLLAGGFTANGIGYWHWLRFGSANLLEAFLLDMPNVYAWNISEVQPTVLWSRTLVFIFRALIEFVVVATLLQQVGIVRKSWHNPRVERQSYLGFIRSQLRSAIYVAIWLIPLASFVGAVVVEELSVRVTWSILRFGVPVIFGSWLAWHSLLAIGIPGKWNKLFSGAGFAGCIWILLKNWSALGALLSH